MRIGILYQDIKSAKIPWQKNREIYTRTAHRTIEISETLTELGHEVIIFSSLNDFMNRFYKETIDLVFPCIECCFERNTNGFISAILQMENIPYVGNDSYLNMIVSDKYLFENIADYLGIRTPKSKLINSQDLPYLPQYMCEVELPCILKYQFGSMSYHTVKIDDFDNLKECLSIMLRKDNGPVLCEKYIEGHELSVPVVGTAPHEQILAVVEYTDSDRKPLEIYDEHWKGENDSQIELNALNSSSPHIKEIICSVHRLYRYLNFQDYARFDFRLDSQGRSFLLEGNPLPAIAYGSAFDPLSYGKDISFKKILSLIIESAANRYGLVL